MHMRLVHRSLGLENVGLKFATCMIWLVDGTQYMHRSMTLKESKAVSEGVTETALSPHNVIDSWLL